MTKTSIEWATDVWNPVTGCSKVSEGCRHCYAERVAGRFWGDRKFTDVRVHPERLDQPLHWKKPRRVFVNSMSDLFHPVVDDDFIEDVFRVMARTPQHTYMVLTKRPEQMRAWFEGYDAVRPLPNVWLGVSVENQKAADERIPMLLGTPAAVRFVSCEPLLGPVKLVKWLPGYDPTQHYELIERQLVIDWVIAGGESGTGARPMQLDWVRGLRDVCVQTQTPFFFKQWGEFHPEFLGRDFEAVCAVCGCSDNDPCEGGCYWSADKNGDDMRDRCSRCSGVKGHRWEDGMYSYHVGKKTAGRMLDGRTWEEFPR